MALAGSFRSVYDVTTKTKPNYYPKNPKTQLPKPMSVLLVKGGRTSTLINLVN